jgi:hypothetical protein
VGFSASGEQLFFGFRDTSDEVRLVRQIHTIDGLVREGRHSLGQSVFILDRSMVVCRPRNNPSEYLVEEVELNSAVLAFQFRSHFPVDQTCPVFKCHLMWQHVMGPSSGVVLCSDGFAEVTFERPVDALARVVGTSAVDELVNGFCNNVEAAATVCLLIAKSKDHRQAGLRLLAELGCGADAFLLRAARILSLVWNAPAVDHDVVGDLRELAADAPELRAFLQQAIDTLNSTARSTEEPFARTFETRSAAPPQQLLEVADDRDQPIERLNESVDAPWKTRCREIQAELDRRTGRDRRTLVSTQALFDECCRTRYWDLALQTIACCASNRRQVISTIWSNFVVEQLAAEGLAAAQQRIIAATERIDPGNGAVDPFVVQPVLEEFRLNRKGAALWAVTTMVRCRFDLRRMLDAYLHCLDDRGLSHEVRCDFCYAAVFLVDRGDTPPRPLGGFWDWFRAYGYRCPYYDDALRIMNRF